MCFSFTILLLELQELERLLPLQERLLLQLEPRLELLLLQQERLPLRLERLQEPQLEPRLQELRLRNLGTYLLR